MPRIKTVAGTAAYVYAGASVPSLRQLADEGVGKVIRWQFLLAFAILGVLPIVIKRIVALLSRYQRNCEEHTDESPEADSIIESHS